MKTNQITDGTGQTADQATSAPRWREAHEIRHAALDLQARQLVLLAQRLSLGLGVVLVFVAAGLALAAHAGWHIAATGGLLGSGIALIRFVANEGSGPDPPAGR